MNELIKLVAAKTGVSESVAKIAVDVVISHLKGKLPPGVGDSLESILGGTGSSKASNPLGGVVDKLGGIFGKK